MPELSVPTERSRWRSEPSRFRSGAGRSDRELSGSLFDGPLVVNNGVVLGLAGATLWCRLAVPPLRRSPGNRSPALLPARLLANLTHIIRRLGFRGGLWLTGWLTQRRRPLPSISRQRQRVSATSARLCRNSRFQPRDRGGGRNPQGSDRAPEDRTANSLALCLTALSWLTTGSSLGWREQRFGVGSLCRRFEGRRGIAPLRFCRRGFLRT